MSYIRVYSYSVDDLTVIDSPVFQRQLTQSIQNLSGEKIRDIATDKIVIGQNTGNTLSNSTQEVSSSSTT